MNKKLGSTLIAMTIIIFMLFLTLGMFTKNFGGSARAEVASAQTKVSGSLINNSDNVDEGDTGEYEFHIKNTDDNGNSTQVKMHYKIIVETQQVDTTEPVTVHYQLFPAKYDERNNEYVVDNDNVYINENEVDENNVEFTSTEAIPMELGIDTDEQVDNYILKFTPENEGKFNFKVKVESTQVD